KLRVVTELWRPYRSEYSLYTLDRLRKEFSVSLNPLGEGQMPVSSETETAISDSRFHDQVAAATKRSQDYLLGVQHPEGYWVGELIVDSTLVSDTIAYHHWNGKVDKEWQRKAVNQIMSMQLPDGGWNIYYGGPAEVNATIKAYLALKLAGVSVTDRRMLRAPEVAMNLAAVPPMNPFSIL